jgi:zinc dependent phospholipase C
MLLAHIARMAILIAKYVHTLWFRVYKLFWLVPIIIYSSDANAWGLITHLYFAQSLLWAMPLLDPRLQRAIRLFPELVMAGACLPDLAIVSPALRHSHHWENSQHLLLSAVTDEEVAIAIGYASHLYVDVIAHNHFVPAREAMWLQNTMLTHIAAEWAMDAHLAPLLGISPGYLLNKHRGIDTLCRAAFQML